MKRPAVWSALAIALWLGAVAIQTIRAPHWGYRNGQMTEWLINYQGGFVRRGLPGEIFFQAQHFFGVPANWLAIAASLALYGVLALWFARHAAPRFGWILVASSVLLGASAFHMYVIRKDSLVIVCLIACLSIDRDASMTAAGRFAARNAVAVATVLSHEAVAFVALPGLILMRTLSVGWRGAYAYLPALIALGVVAAFRGDSATAQAINDSWRDLWQAIDPAGCCFDRPTRGIGWLSMDLSHAFRASIDLLMGGRDRSMVVPTAWAFTTIVCGLALLLASNARPPEEIARLAVTMAFQFAFVAPLAFLGTDTGRWIVMWTLSSVVLRLNGFAEIGWPRLLADRLSTVPIWRRFSQHGYDQRWLLFLGVPGCCWNLGSYFSATPVGFYINGTWIFATEGMRW